MQYLKAHPSTDPLMWTRFSSQPAFPHPFPSLARTSRRCRFLCSFVILHSSTSFPSVFIILPTQNTISPAFLHSSHTRKFYAFNLLLRAPLTQWRCCIHLEDFPANLLHLRNSSGAMFRWHCPFPDLRRALCFILRVRHCYCKTWRWLLPPLSRATHHTNTPPQALMDSPIQGISGSTAFVCVAVLHSCLPLRLHSL